MGNRIYVGNLSYSVSTEDLKKAFGTCGTITDARVMTDKETGQSRGFAFVTFSSDVEASNAIQQWHGQNLGGRDLTVNEAREREAGRGGGGGGGGFRGGNGGGGNGGGGRGGGGGGGGGGRRRDRDEDRG